LLRANPLETYDKSAHFDEWKLLSIGADRRN